MAGPSKAPQQIAAVAVFLPLTLVAVAVRVWIRSKLIRNFGADDTHMLIALLMFTIYCIALMVIVAHGGGTHVQTFEEIRIAIRWTLVAKVFYLVTILFLKISLGLFFLRILQAKWQRRVVWATMIVSTLIQVSHTFILIFSCGNPADYLEHTLQDKCIPKQVELVLAYEQAGFTTATDFIFALLPVPLLWGTTMDLRSKLSVGFILLLGTSGCVCSIIRFDFIDGLATRENFFWNAANVSIWSTIEMGTGIVAGSLATMRPLFKKLVGKVNSLNSSGEKHHKEHYSGDPVNSGLRILQSKKSTITTTTTTTTSTSPSKSGKWALGWNRTGDTTTTCTGPGFSLKSLDDHSNSTPPPATHGAQLVTLRDDIYYPTTVWSRDPERAAIWPYANDTHIDTFAQTSLRPSSASDVRDEEIWTGGGTWGKKLQEIILQSPAAGKRRKGSGASGASDGLAEWERLPDLIPPEPGDLERGDGRPEWDRLPDLVLPEERRGSEGGAPSLVRITSR